MREYSFSLKLGQEPFETARAFCAHRQAAADHARALLSASLNDQPSARSASVMIWESGPRRPIGLGQWDWSADQDLWVWTPAALAP